MIHDLIIVGGGPAGIAAGIYAARKRLKTILLTDEIGGQAVVSPEIQNWIGIPAMSGLEMAERLEEHLKRYADEALEYRKGIRIEKIAKVSDDPIFAAISSGKEEWQSRAVIIASGARRRKLTVPGAEKFEGRGIVYCASCDAPLFSGKRIAVIGGGNAGFETAQQLLQYATSVTILEYASEFRGDEVTRGRVLADPKVHAVLNAELCEVYGEKFVSGIAYRDRKTSEIHKLPLEGVFVEIGSIPNSEMVRGLVELDERGEITIDHRTSRTSVEGIWAAGDVTNQPYKQNNIAMGDAVKALEDAYLWLQKRKG
jgi:alkyl hydroperoxide reductase subunit F